MKRSELKRLIEKLEKDDYGCYDSQASMEEAAREAMQYRTGDMKTILLEMARRLLKLEREIAKRTPGITRVLAKASRPSKQS
jgi:hypothetical protein